jgi:hypothetical protein
MRFQGGCSEQDDSASGFAWVAREPELMFGAEGARILTEISRIPRFTLVFLMKFQTTQG